LDLRIFAEVFNYVAAVSTKYQLPYFFHFMNYIKSTSAQDR